MESRGSDLERVDRALIIEEASQTSTANATGATHAGATLFQGIVSLINLLLGIGILSMPYAMSGAGAAGLVSVLVCCILFCNTGHFIHCGFEMMSERTPRDYPGLGEASLGLLGRRLVSVAAAAELFGASCMSLIIMWRSTEQVLSQVVEGSGIPPAAVHVAALLAGTVAEALLCLFGSYRALAGFSAVGCVSTAMVMLLVAALPLLDPHKRWLQEAPAHHVISTDIIPATAILALGVAGHSAFPSVRASMADKARFPAALNAAYAACAVATGAVCAAGYWYWGDSAHVLVTTDFQDHSPYAAYTLRGFGIQHAVEALVAVNVATKVPLYVIALQDIVTACLGDAVRRGDAAVLPSALYTLRAALVATVIVFSLATQHVLGDLESIIGAVCVIASSLLLPTVFYAALRVRQGSMRPRAWIAVAALLAFGAALMAVVVYQTACKLLTWRRGSVSLTGGLAWLDGAPKGAERSRGW